MIEEVILNYLRENAFSCYMSMPEKPSGNFCILEKTGDSPDEGIYTATLRCSPTAAAPMQQHSSAILWYRPCWLPMPCQKFPHVS